MPRVHEIHLYEADDPVCVENLTKDGVGVLFTVGDVTTFVPWIHVTKIVSYRKPAPDPVSEPVAYTEPDTGTDDQAGSGSDDDGPGDPGTDDTSKADWPEPDNATMRTWAQSQGLAVSASGPVSKDVKSAYAAAHADQ